MTPLRSNGADGEHRDGDVPEEITLYSSGSVPLVADYYPPRSVSPARSPGVVLCPGFGGVKGQLANWALDLNERDFAVLVPDYRGFGKSGGSRGRIAPLEQVADIRASLTFLSARPEVDPQRLGLVGISAGGANAVQAAGWDDRPRAVVTVNGFGDGERKARSVRRHYEWLAFVRRLEEDRVRRTLTGASEVIDPDEILVRDPEGLRWRRETEARNPEMKFMTTLETADLYTYFHPERVLPFASGAALLVIQSRDDTAAPEEEGLSLYSRAAEPKRLVLADRASHYDMHGGPIYEAMVTETALWLGEHLRVTRADGAAGDRRFIRTPSA